MLSLPLRPWGDRVFHGWVMVAVTFVFQFVAVGLSYYAFGVYLKPLTEALDADRFLISLALSTQSGVVAVMSPLAGRWFAHYPVKPLMLTGMAALALGMLLMSQVTELWQLYVLFGGLVAIGQVLLATLPCNMLLANWFETRRGTAMGISQFGITSSATLLVPLVTWLIIAFEWRTSFVILGIGTVLVLAPLIILFVVRSPAELGLHPDGNGTPPAVDTQFERTHWTVFKALQNRDFWLITLTIGPCYMGVASVVLAMPSHTTDMGYTPMQASYVVAATTAFGALAKPLFGILSDHFNIKRVLAVAIALQLVGVILLLATSDLSGLITAGIVFGLGYGGIAPLWSIVLARRFGREDFPQAMGANMPMLMPFNLIGLPLTTYIFGLTGSYLPAFSIHLGGYTLALIALACLRLQRR